MDVSHVLVGGLTAISIALLVGIEIRSRRKPAVQPDHQSVSEALVEGQPPPKKKGRGRR